MSEPKEECERNPNAIAEDWRKITEKMTTDEKNQYMLEHSISTDCTFVVGPEDGETKEFKAHRFLLCNASPVFEKMLTGEMVEAKTGHVRVTDLSPNTFQLLLSSIYGKDPETTTFQEAQEFAYAADKYQINLLLEVGVTYMCALISPENIWTAFETADLLQNKHLRNFCIEILQRDTLRCITNSGFMQASEENVALLLVQDELNVDDELLLVNIIVHWARHAARQRGLPDDDSNVRAVLEPRLLSLFRFLAMSPQQFMYGPGLAGWLNSDEKANISKCLLLKDFGTLLPRLCALAEKRKTVTRSIQTPGSFICKRKIIGSIGTRPNARQIVTDCCVYYNSIYYHCVHAKLIFKVSSSCKLLGFVCANRCRADTSVDPTAFEAKNPQYKEKIVAIAFEFNHTLATGFKESEIADTYYGPVDAEYNSSSSIMFKEPVTLVPDNWFAVDVAFQHKASYSNYQTNSVVPPGEYPNPTRARCVRTAAGVEFTFHTEELEGYHTSLYDGVFEALIFSF